MNCESVLTILMSIASLVKIIKEMMILVQSEFPAGSGAEKKVAVLDGLSAIVGNDTVWTKIQSLVAITIDFLCVFKPKKE
jgi:hypothetical protein